MAYEQELMEALDGETAGEFGIFYEHPGWINLVHKDTEGVVVAATPLYDGDNQINVQITTDDGDDVSFFDINYEYTGNLQSDIRLYKQKIEEHGRMILDAVKEHRKTLEK